MLDEKILEQIILEEVQIAIDEGLMDFAKGIGRKSRAAAAGIAMMGALAGGTAQAEPSADQQVQSASVKPSDPALGFDKVADHEKLADKLFDGIMAEIKADKSKVKLAKKLSKKEFRSLILKLSNQAFNNLGRFSSEEEILEAVKKVVNASHDLNPSSIKNRAKANSKR